MDKILTMSSNLIKIITICQAQCSMPTIPATREAEVGRLQSKANLGKRTRPDLKKNRLKAKVLQAWFKWYSACLASMRPQLQTLPKNSNNSRGRKYEYVGIREEGTKWLFSTG
jgi:hypothetical protein